MSVQKDIEVIDEALSECRERIAKCPSYELLNSIEQQLLYLRSLLDGSEIDKSRLSKIILGVYAVREFSETDRFFAELLVDANEIAGRLKY
ncbi:immunity protein Tsi6 family protein [Agarivorans gilvus]|uniref:immunity protein Tsi6 family protein n=1 Tax=Agarivorans gilvus TaxID=680279 RepID=UPI0006EBFF91|nr:immunity protein Tsi6 family protein [Agarivorans gilvus]